MSAGGHYLETEIALTILFFFNCVMSSERDKEGYSGKHGGLFQSVTFHGEKTGPVDGVDPDEAGSSRAEGREAPHKDAAGNHRAGEEEK